MKKDFVKRTLKNGIDVYLYKDKNLKRTVVSYNVKYGSLGYYDKFYYKDQSFSVPPAMAHFLEHMLIEHSKFGNMLYRFKDKNYEVNGVTYPELTSFYFIGVKDIKESIRELITMIDDPVFTEESVEESKAAIIEEANKNDDAKYRIAYNANKRNVYANFETVSESYNTLGTKETTKSITYEDARVCYDAYYNDENKFLVIGGPIDIDETIQYLESIYENLPHHKNEMREYDYPDIFDVRKEFEIITKPVSEDHLIVTYKFKNIFEERKLLVDLKLYFYTRMKFSSDTKFVSRLNEDKIIRGKIDVGVEYFKDIITISFSADVLDVEEFIARLESEINLEGLDEKEFDLIMKGLKVNDISKMDYIYRHLRRFPLDVEFTDKLYTLDVINTCTLDSVKELVSKLKFDTKTVTHIKKEVD